MELISFTNENGLLTVFLKDRIDSANASRIESEIETVRTEQPHSAIQFDVEELAYTSSAGLRVILHVRKNEPTLKIINASSEVYDIFEMTGFTEMIPVTKAYRRLSVDGCEVIGQGANGKVYRIDTDTIVKVYFNSDALPDIQRERELARRAFVLGIPTAIPYDVVKVGDGYGSVFELLNAKSFAKLIQAEPDKLDEYVTLYVDLLKKIHATEVKPEEMPDMREVAINWAEFLLDYLPPENGKKLVELVKAVPTDNHMLHGDYHVKNVLMQNGEVLLIDMDTLCHGHPVFELASIFNAYAGFSELDHSVSQRFLGLDHDITTLLWQKTLPMYLGTQDPEIIAATDQKVQLVGYTRLMRRLIRRNGLAEEQSRREIEVYKQHIIELLDRVDTLIF